MANNLQDIGRKMQDLAARSVEAQVRAALRYSELMGRFARGELFTRAVGDEYARVARDETNRYVSTIATLSVNYFNSLIELGQAYNDRFFEQVLGSRSGPAAPRPDLTKEVSPRRVELETHAPLGQEAILSFTLENRHAETAEISFLVSDFAGPAGTAAFHAPIEFQPPRVTLGPGEARAVTLRLRLTPPLFAAGERYTATVVVRGYSGLELGVGIRVESASAPSDVITRSTADAETSSEPANVRKSSSKSRRRRHVSKGKANDR